MEDAKYFAYSMSAVLLCFFMIAGMGLYSSHVISMEKLQIERLKLQVQQYNTVLITNTNN